MTTRNRPARLISIPAATWRAPWREACWWFNPFHIMRRTGSRESRERRDASATSPTSIAVKTFSIRLGSRRVQRISHQQTRSSTTAMAVIETSRIGHMIGPPLWKLSIRKFPVSTCPVPGKPAAAGEGEVPAAAGCIPAAVEGFIPSTGDNPGMLAGLIAGAVPGIPAGLIAGRGRSERRLGRRPGWSTDRRRTAGRRRW